MGRLYIRKPEQADSLTDDCSIFESFTLSRARSARPIHGRMCWSTDALYWTPTRAAAARPAVMLVSMIVPAYNAAPYIGDAIESLRTQTLRDIEIIVVDDGSTDHTVEIAQQHAARDPRVRIIRRNTASGRPACARNDGLRAASGRYVGFLDADDLAVPDRLERTMNAIGITGAQFAFANVRFLYDASGTYDVETMLGRADFVKRAARYMTCVSSGIYSCHGDFVNFLLASLCAVHTPTVVFERALLTEQRVWFDESLTCGEDLDLWFRLGMRTRFAFVDSVLAFYRKHSRSITTTQATLTIADGAGVLQRALYCLNPTMSRQEIRSAKRRISVMYADAGYGLWYDGQPREARALFRLSFIHQPSVAAIKGYIKALIPRATGLAVVSRLGLR